MYGHLGARAYAFFAARRDRDSVICVTCNKKPSSQPLQCPEYCFMCFYIRNHCIECGSNYVPVRGCCSHKSYQNICKHKNKTLPLKYSQNCFKCFASSRAVIGWSDNQFGYTCCGCGSVNDLKEFIIYEAHGAFRMCNECAKPIIITHCLNVHITKELANMIWQMLIC